jgi:hypothetical protein
MYIFSTMENNQAGVLKLIFGSKEFNIIQKIHVYHIYVFI